MNLIYRTVGKVCDKVRSFYASYKAQCISELVQGEGVRIGYPFNIAGAENIEAGECVSIGVGATIFTTRAKLIIKQHFIAGPGLTVITGDHMPILGRFIDTISDTDKDRLDTKHLYDQDVVIEEDVWCGANVTILKGVTIGRGSIIAAGAVVTKDIPRYSIAGGVPARVLKQRLTDEEIRIHEKQLYKEHDDETKAERIVEKDYSV